MYEEDPPELEAECDDLAITGDYMAQIYCMWGYEDGTRCRARCRKGSRYCYWHDPATRQSRETGLERLYAAPKGEPITMGELTLENEEDVRALLCKVAHYLATSQRPDVGRAHALSTTALHVLKAFDIRRLQDEVKELRAENQRLRTAATQIDEAPVAKDRLPAGETPPEKPQLPEESRRALYPRFPFPYTPAESER